MKLDDWQQSALEKACDPSAPNCFIAWCKQGTGKSRFALALFENSGCTTLTIVTRRVAFLTWVDEIVECGLNDYIVYENDFKTSSILLHSKKPYKESKIILLVSAGSLDKIPTKLISGEMLIVDELYLFSNPKAKRSRNLQRISLFCSLRVGLSGTIMPANDITTIFGQLMALQAHMLLSRNISSFRSEYTIMAKGQFGKVFHTKPNAFERIKQKLDRMIYVHYPESRPTRTQIVKVKKDLSQIKAVKELQELYELNEKTYDHTLQIVHAVNGISNGWWIDGKEELVFTKSPKLDLLLSLVDDLIAAGEKVVIWCSYHNDILRILADIKHPSLCFTGKEDFAEGDWKAGRFNIVLATEANGASVNYFKDVRYAIYYSINFKLLDLQQSMMRHERRGSNHEGAHYYFLQTQGTLDAHTYNLVTKSDLAEKELITALGNTLNNL